MRIVRIVALVAEEGISSEVTIDLAYWSPLVHGRAAVMFFILPHYGPLLVEPFSQQNGWDGR